eukprot:scaffold3824_cov108-Isochrysis_galbana.AAC.2
MAPGVTFMAVLAAGAAGAAEVAGAGRFALVVAVLACAQANAYRAGCRRRPPPPPQRRGREQGSCPPDTQRRSQAPNGVPAPATEPVGPRAPMAGVGGQGSPCWSLGSKGITFPSSSYR